MQTHISEILNSLDIGGVIETNTNLLVRIRFRTKDGRRPLERFSQNFKEIGKEKEIEPVIDSLWNIIGELQPNVYPRNTQNLVGLMSTPRIIGKKLVSLLRKHNKSTSRAKVGQEARGS